MRKITSCAARYRSVNPSTLYEPSVEKANGVNFSYRYNVPKQAGNKKSAKKEDKHRMRVVAENSVNNSGKTLLYGNRESDVIEPQALTPFLKQTVPAYLLYLLFTPTGITTIDSTAIVNSTPIGFVLGPAPAIGNMAVACSANNHFKTELQDNSLLHREIRNGKSFYRLVSITDNGFAPLTLKLIQ